jgi:hypothetical protein
MENSTRTGNDATCITNGIVQITPFHAANDAATTYLNILAPRCFVFFSRGDWKLIMTADNHPYNGQWYRTNIAFNI